MKRVVESGACGLCFQNVWQYANQHAKKHGLKSNLRVVHGKVRLISTGQVIDHAWIEEGNKVIDPTAGVTMAKKRWYELLDARPESKYTVEEAMVASFRSQHYGPWE